MDRVRVEFQIADVHPHGLNMDRVRVDFQVADVYPHGLNHGQGQS